MTTHAQSVRDYLAQLEARGALRDVRETVNPDFELSACLYEAGSGPALRFLRLTGYEMGAFGNLLNSRARIALGLGVQTSALQGALITAVAEARDPVFVADAPCQEVSMPSPDLALLPVPRFFEHETGPYLTAGAIVAQDPETGRGNLSYARVKPLGGNRAFIGIAPEHHLAVFARRAQARGRKLPIALILGNHPAVMIAAALYLGEGEDELRVASALFPQPLVAARTLAGLAVPAHCEIVLEGDIDAGTAVSEGPVSEYHGMYEDYGAGMLVEFTRMSRRRDAMLQVIQPGFAPEHVWIGGEAIAASLARRLRPAFPGLKEVAITPGGAGRLHAVLAASDEDARALMHAVWNAVRLIKLVTVVDVDVDPWDATQVELALATRMRAERDLTVLADARTSRSDPLQRSASVGKLGIDAMRKPTDRSDWRRAEPLAEARARAHRILSST
jgi:2,5-furandicarboxylate decarboxylase 1